MKTRNYIIAPAPSEHPTFNPSDSAFDAVAENRFTYGKPKSESKGPKVSDNGYGVSCSSEKVAKDKRVTGKHIYAFTPAALRPDYPAARVSGGIVAVSQGERATKRFRVIKTDAVTQEETSFLVTLTTNTVSVLSYGQIFEFSCSSRAKGTFGDSRDGKRHPLSFAKSELRRILGATEGDAEFKELTTFPTRNPAALLPNCVQPGSTVA